MQAKVLLDGCPQSLLAGSHLPTPGSEPSHCLVLPSAFPLSFPSLPLAWEPLAEASELCSSQQLCLFGPEEND